MTGFLDWYRAGGPIMHFILMTAIAGLAVTIERFYVLKFKSAIKALEE